MKLENIPKNNLVCLRYIHNIRWILLTRWTDEIKNVYNSSHSLPYTSQKHNTEIIFPEAVYTYLEITEQTRDKLLSVYNKIEKKPFRTKILEHELFFIF